MIASFPLLAVLCASLNWTSKSDGQQVKDEPATLQRAVKIVNLKGFTKLNAGSIFRDQPTACEYTSKSSFAAAKGYYKAELASRGWTEMKGLSSDTLQYYDRTYTKDGFLLRFTAYPRDPDTTGVNLANYGNVEAAALPKPEGYQLPAEPIPISCSGFVDGDLDSAVTAVRRVLQPQDWHEYVDPPELPSNPKQIRTLKFHRNAMNIQVLVTRHPSGQTMVSYILMPMSSFDVPLPKDTAKLQFQIEIEDGSGHATFQTKLTAREFAEFLRKAGAELGWTNRTPSDAQNFLVFEDAVGWRYAASLGDAKEGGTRVEFDGLPKPKTPQLGEAPSQPRPRQVERRLIANEDPIKQHMEAIDSASSAIVKAADSESLEVLGNQIDALMKKVTDSGSARRGPVPAEESKAAPTPAPEASPNADTAIDAESFPLSRSAQQIVRDATRKEIRYTSTPKAEVQGKFLQSTLESRGWERGSRSQSTANDVEWLDLWFNKNDRSLKVEIRYKVNEGSGATTISGDGLQFPPVAAVPVATPTPAPASAGNLAAKDVKGLPVPDASTNLRDESSPYRRSLETAVTSSLDAVVAFYRREMPGRGYQESAESKVEADQAKLVFNGPDSALTASFSRAGGDVKIALIERHPTAAQRDGVAPPAGKARLLLASQAAADATVTINGSPYTVKAGTGAQSPAQSFKVDLFPGTNKLVVKLAGKGDQPLDVPVTTGETWGAVILGEGQVFGPLRFY
jgi:hypothetical protein